MVRKENVCTIQFRLDDFSNRVVIEEKVIYPIPIKTFCRLRWKNLLTSVTEYYLAMKFINFRSLFLVMFLHQQSCITELLSKAAHQSFIFILIKPGDYSSECGGGGGEIW